MELRWPRESFNELTTWLMLRNKSLKKKLKFLVNRIALVSCSWPRLEALESRIARLRHVFEVHAIKDIKYVALPKFRDWRTEKRLHEKWPNLQLTEWPLKHPHPFRTARSSFSGRKMMHPKLEPWPEMLSDGTSWTTKDSRDTVQGHLLMPIFTLSWQWLRIIRQLPQ